jgi:hypothetical protein
MQEKSHLFYSKTFQIEDILIVHSNGYVLTDTINIIIEISYHIAYLLVYLKLLFTLQYNFGFIVCYDIDNVHIEVISIQKFINIDRRKLVEILVLILKEVIDRFI